MKFFLDTANVEQIRDMASRGILDGVTTNPTLLSKESGNFRDVLKEICGIVDGPVNAEVVSRDWEGMVREGREHRKIADNIVVKIPMSKEGMRAVYELAQEETPTNVTLIFSPVQALLAAKAGASFISPFVGRVDDMAYDGMGLIQSIAEIFGNYAFSTEILVASIRGPMHVVQAAQMGAHIATMPYAVLDKLFQHPLTDIGIELFEKDWQKVKK